MTPPTTDPLALAHAALMEAAALLHSVGMMPDLDSTLAGEARAASLEVMDVLEAYPHLWGPEIADPG